ncbi:MAG: DUF2199 domain-containing protein [Hyphomicrobiales bacterium]
MDYAWTCGCCGKQHNTLPLDHAYYSPDQWHGLSDAERESRAKLNADVCIIDRRDFFIRGCLEIPIVDSAQKFVWGLWVSVSETSFLRVMDLWDAPSVEDEPPLFGWLCNSIEIYPATFGLKTNLRLRSGGIRPAIELEPTDHPLAVEQRQGVSVRRIEELVTALMPRH